MVPGGGFEPPTRGFSTSSQYHLKQWFNFKPTSFSINTIQWLSSFVANQKLRHILIVLMLFPTSNSTEVHYEY